MLPNSWTAIYSPYKFRLFKCYNLLHFVIIDRHLWNKKVNLLAYPLLHCQCVILAFYHSGNKCTANLHFMQMVYLNPLHTTQVLPKILNPAGRVLASSYPSNFSIDLHAVNTILFWVFRKAICLEKIVHHSFFMYLTNLATYLCIFSYNILRNLMSIPCSDKIKLIFKIIIMINITIYYGGCAKFHNRMMQVCNKFL